MKYLPFLILFFTSLLGQSQGASFEIMYKSLSMTKNSYNQPRQHFMKLYVKDDSSLYQWEAQRKLDSISAHREIENEDLGRYFSTEEYVIEIENNTLKYYDVIGDVEYQYEETLSYKWDFKPETKTIKGYKCKRATVTYGGRDWEAWYAIDIPINAGPYKFKGLPGLIIKITDSTYSYDFELFSLKEVENLPLKKGFHHSKENNRIKTNRNKYNKTRFVYNSLSFSERMAVLNKQNGNNTTLEFTNTDGSNPFSGTRSIDKSKNNNFIEIDHD